MAEKIEVTHVPESEYLQSLESRSDLKVNYAQDGLLSANNGTLGNWMADECASVFTS